MPLFLPVLIKSKTKPVSGNIDEESCQSKLVNKTILDKFNVLGVGDVK